jgi:hypothetical protein
MNADKVKNIIQAELQSGETISNWHGLSLNKCLVEPVLMDFEDSFNNGEIIKLWLVLEERPDEKDGYKIVYDPDENEFGLATNGNELPVLISFYGDFIETLEGM